MAMLRAFARKSLSYAKYCVADGFKVS